MTARFLFRFGMLRTFKHKTRGHKTAPTVERSALRLWLAKYVIALELLSHNMGRRVNSTARSRRYGGLRFDPYDLGLALNR